MTQMKKIKCPKCGGEMAVYGVTEKGMLKYHCAECYFVTEEKDEKLESKPEILKIV
jgi:transposase-like protein